jgi:hypothetical protein
MLQKLFNFGASVDILQRASSINMHEMHVPLQNMSQSIRMFELHNRILEHSGKKVQIMSDRHIPEQRVRSMRKLPIFVHHMLQQHLLHNLQRRILSVSEHVYQRLGNL